MNFALTFVLAAFIGSATCQLQYDDLSVLGEVVEGSGVEVEKTSVPTTTTAVVEEKETTTTVASTTEAETTTTAEASTTTEASTTPTTTTEAETTTTAVESTTTEAATTTEEPTTTSTETTTQEVVTIPEVLIPDTTPTEEVDEESFLGFKKPDLATIYRRLFPFQHHPGQKQGQYRQGQFGQQGAF